jgi:hypothetical protein
VVGVLVHWGDGDVGSNREMRLLIGGGARQPGYHRSRKGCVMDDAAARNEPPADWEHPNSRHAKGRGQRGAA